MSKPILPFWKRTSLPFSGYFGSLIFGELATALCFTTLNRQINDNNAVVLIAIACFATGRYLLAVMRRDQSRIWLVYCLIWLLLPAEWLVGQAILRAFLS